MAGLDRAGRLVEGGVRPGGMFDGWSGRDVLCHLGAYARLAGAILQAEAESRQPSTSELYGRELSNEELAIVGLDHVKRRVLDIGERRALWERLQFALARQRSERLALGPS